MSGKRAKTRSGKGNTNQISSPVESPISVVRKSPYGQVDFLLRSRLLTLRHKVLNMDIDLLLDLIKMMNKKEGGNHVPYERHLSLQGPGCVSILSSSVDPARQTKLQTTSNSIEIS
jgi:hypothetical protein